MVVVVVVVEGVVVAVMVVGMMAAVVAVVGAIVVCCGNDTTMMGLPRCKRFDGISCLLWIREENLLNAVLFIVPLKKAFVQLGFEQNCKRVGRPW